MALGVEERDLVDVAVLQAELRGPRSLAITYDKSKTQAGALLQRLGSAGLSIVDVSTQEADLEDVFLKLTKRAA